MDKNEFGEYLRELRNQRKLTTYQVELYAGVSNSYLSLIENGKRGIPSARVLKKLAPVYKVSYEELMAKAGYIPEGESNLYLSEWDERISNLSEENQQIIEKVLRGLEAAERIKKESEGTDQGGG